MIRGIRRMAELRSGDSTLATEMKALDNEDWFWFMQTWDNEDWLRFLTLKDWIVMKRQVVRRTSEDDQWLHHLMAEDWSTLKRLVLERAARERRGKKAKPRGKSMPESAGGRNGKHLFASRLPCTQ